MTDFSTHYRRYAPDVYRFALYLCGRREEAEDLTSETFVRAWTSPEPIRMETVKGYLFTIARNLHLQVLRRSRRHVEMPEELADTAPDPLARAERSSQVDAVLEALRELPESSREALLLRAVEGLSYEEIARALGISLVAVKVRIHRARAALLGLKDV